MTSISAVPATPLRPRGAVPAPAGGTGFGAVLAGLGAGAPATPGTEQVAGDTPAGALGAHPDAPAPDPAPPVGAGEVAALTGRPHGCPPAVLADAPPAVDPVPGEAVPAAAPGCATATSTVTDAGASTGTSAASGAAIGSAPATAPGAVPSAAPTPVPTAPVPTTPVPTTPVPTTPVPTTPVPTTPVPTTPPAGDGSAAVPGHAAPGPCEAAILPSDGALPGTPTGAVGATAGAVGSSAVTLGATGMPSPLAPATTAGPVAGLPSLVDEGLDTGSAYAVAVPSPDPVPAGTEQPVAAGAAAPTAGPTPAPASAPTLAPAPPGGPAPAPAPPAAQVLTLLAPVLEGPDGTYVLALQLYPEELGAVQVDVLLRGGEIRLALHTADDAAQQVLRAALPDLRADLASAGLQATQLSVDGGRSDASSQQQQDRLPRSYGRPSRDDDTERTPHSSPTRPAAAPDAALDLRM